MTELEQLRSACLEALETLSSRPESNPQVRALADQMRTVVEKQYQGKSRPGLRSIAAEIRGWAREIGGDTARRVEESLEPTRVRPEVSQKGQIESIISRGRVRSNKEYQLLMDRVEEIYGNASEQEMVRVLNDLLADYVRRHNQG